MENGKQANKMPIASARWEQQSVSPSSCCFLAPLSPNDRERSYSSARLVLHKSHWGRFMVDRCLSLLSQGRGFTVSDSDPELTSPCVATETEELRKREEARQLRPDGVREERSEVVCLFTYNCLGLALSRCCRLSYSQRHLWQTHTETHAAAVVCSCTSAWGQPYSLLLIWQSAVSSPSHKKIFQHSWLPPRWRVGSQTWPTGWFWTIT